MTIDLSKVPFLLFIVFLVLKLTDKIKWSWIWVTSPLWISLGIWLITLIVVGILTYILVKE